MLKYFRVKGQPERVVPDLGAISAMMSAAVTSFFVTCFGKFQVEAFICGPPRVLRSSHCPR